MNNELIFYDNKINTLDFRNLSEKEMDMFMFIISKIPYPKEGEPTGKKIQIKVNYDEIEKRLSITRLSQDAFMKAIDNMNKKLMQITVTWNTEKGTEYLSIFNHISWDEYQENVQLDIVEEFAFLLDVLCKKGGFTVIELKKYLSLNSKSAKGLYRILAQYRKSGKIYKLNIEDFKRILGASKSVNGADFIKKYLMPALETLKNNGCIIDYEKPEAEYYKRPGSPVKDISINFTFAGENKIVEEKLDINQVEKTAKALGVPVETLLALQQSNPVVKQEPKPITKVEPVEEEVPCYEKTLIADDDDYLLECVEQLKAEMPFV